MIFSFFFTEKCYKVTLDECKTTCHCIQQVITRHSTQPECLQCFQNSILPELLTLPLRALTSHDESVLPNSDVIESLAACISGIVSQLDDWYVCHLYHSWFENLGVKDTS